MDDFASQLFSVMLNVSMNLSTDLLTEKAVNVVKSFPFTFIVIGNQGFMVI